MDATKPAEAPDSARRYKAYAETHQALIEAAVRLISEKGVEALSVAGLARAIGMNRTTVYYHFGSREALLEAVASWSSEQLARAFDPHESQRNRIDFIARFVLDNPDLIKLWIDQFIAAGDIRDRYPKWDELVAGTGESLGPEVDAEVYCTILLAGAIVGPRVFRNSVRPDLSEDEIVARFRAEHQRILRRDSLLRE
ncbi:MAG: helix-turn-helix transcriptional regulator [Novosphingobium sp.]|nr:helix-turn-helix transcriptional regulator [Novosphingobium sp.]